MLKHTPSKIRCGVFAIIVSVASITGCASQKLTTTDIANYETNCSQSQEQVRYLYNNTPTKDDQLVAVVKIMLMGPFAPLSKDYERDLEIAQGQGRYWSELKRERIKQCK